MKKFFWLLPLLLLATACVAGDPKTGQPYPSDSGLEGPMTYIWTLVLPLGFLGGGALIVGKLFSVWSATSVQRRQVAREAIPFVAYGTYAVLVAILGYILGIDVLELLSQFVVGASLILGQLVGIPTVIFGAPLLFYYLGKRVSKTIRARRSEPVVAAT